MRYVLVGGGAFITEYGSFYVLFAVLHMRLLLANGISFCLGLGISFVLSRVWTFQHQEKVYQKKTAHQFSFYMTLSLINLGLTLLLVSYFKHLGIDPRIGKLLAMAITSLWNFMLLKHFIFNHAETHNVSEN
jgi:putative flippase GtrA